MQSSIYSAGLIEHATKGLCTVPLDGKQDNTLALCRLPRFGILVKTLCCRLVAKLRFGSLKYSGILVSCEYSLGTYEWTGPRWPEGISYKLREPNTVVSCASKAEVFKFTLQCCIGTCASRRSENNNILQRHHIRIPPGLWSTDISGLFGSSRQKSVVCFSMISSTRHRLRDVKCFTFYTVLATCRMVL